MNQVNRDEKYLPGAPVPCVQPLVYQPTSQVEFFQGGPVNYLPEGTRNLPSMTMTSTQAPQLPSSTLQYNGDTLNHMRNYCMHTQPVGFPPGCPFTIPPEGTQYLPSTWPSHMTSTQTPQPLPRSLEHKTKTLDGPQKITNMLPTLPGTSGDLTACQLHNSSSSLPQGEAGSSSHDSLKEKETSQKRELRLMKNREAARECRRKKKEYVKCLENRVAVLENQNRTLIEELRALKDIYRHKVEDCQIMQKKEGIYGRTADSEHLTGATE